MEPHVYFETALGSKMLFTDITLIALHSSVRSLVGFQCTPYGKCPKTPKLTCNAAAKYCSALDTILMLCSFEMNIVIAIIKTCVFTLK